MLVRNQVAMRTSGAEEQVSQRRSASLARLAQAAAKMDFSDTVEPRHAEFAIATMSGAEQDRDPGALRGAINKDTCKKASVWDVQTIHTNLGQNSYTVWNSMQRSTLSGILLGERSQSSANSAAFLTRLRRKTSTGNSAH